MRPIRPLSIPLTALAVLLAVLLAAALPPQAAARPQVGPVSATSAAPDAAGPAATVVLAQATQALTPQATPATRPDASAQVTPAQDTPAQAPPVHARWELFQLPDGAPLALLWLTPAQGFKFYAADPGQTGMPTRVEARLTPRGDPLAVLAPTGKKTQDLYEKDKTVFVHDAPTPFFLPLPADPPRDFGLQARISLLACTETSCWPVLLETDFSARQSPQPLKAAGQPWWGQFTALVKAAQAETTTGTASPRVAPGTASEADLSATDWSFSPRQTTPRLEVTGLAKALPLAVLAGIILNLMPCVLPVACLKLSSLLAACSLDEACRRHSRIRRHNTFFALGILAYFCLLAVLLGLADMAWGQLFQRPGVILGAAAALFALGLSLFGVFHLPVIDLKIAAKQDTHPDAQALATGFLATLLATPCSGPFLGGVLAWTLLQPVAVVVTVFLGIGLGMALPYLVLAARPELTRFVPRPGPWMTHLEKLAGFLLMAACLYFLSILPAPMLLPALLALLATAFAAHAWGAWTSLSQGVFTRLSIRLAALVLAVVACLWALAPPAPAGDVWKPFDAGAFRQALGRENILLDFTADWCPTCKALEKTVLSDEAVARLAKRHGFTAMRVDLTHENPQAMALLRALGSASIPLAAAFPKGEASGRPVVLRDLFTSGQLEEALKEAFGPGS